MAEKQGLPVRHFESALHAALPGQERGGSRAGSARAAGSLALEQERQQQRTPTNVQRPGHRDTGFQSPGCGAQPIPAAGQASGDTC